MCRPPGTRKASRVCYIPRMRLLVAVHLVAGILIAGLTAAPRPPKQPATGAGGAEYPHAKVRESEFGEGSTQYWIFEPQKPQPVGAPLIIFLHGYSAMNPDPYHTWIRHLTLRGNIVVYPRYQADLLTPPAEYHENAAQSVRDALRVLSGKGRVSPDPERVAVVGHSAGGIGAATWAARALQEKLPCPRAVMAVHPGQGPENGIQLVPLDDYTKIPASTRLVVMASEEDGFVGLGSSRRIWAQTAQIQDRAFVTLKADRHGFPPLLPRHLAPLAADRLSTDALDWLGYWRVFDTLCAAAFSGAKTDIPPAMGTWSDGTPVKPLTITR